MLEHEICMKSERGTIDNEAMIGSTSGSVRIRQICQNLSKQRGRYAMSALSGPGVVIHISPTGSGCRVPQDVIQTDVKAHSG
jgi:uncharacterized protein YlxW (UPF0749 family)